MFNFSLSACRHVVCRRSFSLMCHNFTQNKPNPDYVVFEMGFISWESINQAKPGLSFTTEYLKNMKNTDDIHWDWLTKKLEVLKMNNIPTKILQACVRLDNLDLGLRYYNYLVDKGVKLSPVDLIFFSKLIAKKKSEMKNYEQLLIHLYNDIKEFLQSSLLIRKFLMEVFVEIPPCFNDIVKRGKHPTVRGGYMPVVEKSLELNMPDAAFEFMNDTDFCANTRFMEKYLNFCIRTAEEGKFSVDFINKLINVCNKRVIPLSHENLLEPLNALVSALNKHDSYQWSVHECEVNEKQECSKCGLTLLPNNITDEEFQQLKEFFFKQSYIDSDVFLSSTRMELQKFLKFLKRIEPYTLVIDGLNMLLQQSRVDFFNRVLKHFLGKGHNVLTIGRKHSRQIITNSPVLNEGDYESRFQCFFVSDTSDDDMFLLYAALYGGPGTLFLTGDFLKSYSKIPDEDMRCTFLKWQISHQHFVRFTMHLESPLPHCGLSQLTLNTDKQYIWHLSQQTSPTKPTVDILSPINWYCLKAEKKS